MARGEPALLIPGIDALPADWLKGAELSVSLEEPGRRGLSLYCYDEESFGRFAAELSLPERIVAAQRELRRKYDLVPRYWIKLHFREGRTAGYSQYFQIHPRNHYPVTTLRLFLREYGVRDVGEIEELLKAPLESTATRWGFALKHHPEETVARVFFGIGRPRLGEVIEPFVRLGYLDGTCAGRYLEWAQQAEAGEELFVSVDPGRRLFSSVDLSDASSRGLVGRSALALPEKLSYLKMRIADPAAPPSFTAYLPLALPRGGAA